MALAYTVFLLPVGLPGVLWVLPDSYIDVKNKDYGGQCNTTNLCGGAFSCVLLLPSYDDQPVYLSSIQVTNT
jgi:hypothetical protein